MDKEWRLTHQESRVNRHDVKVNSPSICFNLPFRNWQMDCELDPRIIVPALPAFTFTGLNHRLEGTTIISFVGELPVIFSLLTGKFPRNDLSSIWIGNSCWQQPDSNPDSRTDDCPLTVIGPRSTGCWLKGPTVKEMWLFFLGLSSAFGYKFKSKCRETMKKNRRDKIGRERQWMSVGAAACCQPLSQHHSTVLSS